MGYHNQAYGAWIEAEGYESQRPYTYQTRLMSVSPLIERIVASGARNDRIVIRKVERKPTPRPRSSRRSLNDRMERVLASATTDAEVSPTLASSRSQSCLTDPSALPRLMAKSVAFMDDLSDMRKSLLCGSLPCVHRGCCFGGGCAPKVRTMRVPLISVVKTVATRMASQLFMLVFIRDSATSKFGASRGEFG
jgi:hypothetical protein